LIQDVEIIGGATRIPFV